MIGNRLYKQIGLFYVWESVDSAIIAYERIQAMYGGL